MTSDPKPKGGFIRNTWRWLWSPSARWSLGSIFAAGGIAGIIFWGGFNTFMEYTNRLEFCISCHEMSSMPFENIKRPRIIKVPLACGRFVLIVTFQRSGARN